MPPNSNGNSLHFFSCSRHFFPPSLSNPEIFSTFSKTSLPFSATKRRRRKEDMENSIHGVPPLKRFKLKRKLEDESLNSSRLPAKKRKESRYPSLDPPLPLSIDTSFCLPAKKRIWALQPPSTPQKPSLPFDLNVEYQPSPEKKPPTSQEELKSFSTANLDSEEKEEKSPIEENPAADEGSNHEEQKEEEEDDGIVCDICRSTDGDPSDPIVLCDGCDLMVHSTCYGNPLILGIPEGDWFCARCQANLPSRKVGADGDDEGSCCLCPVKGGAMKPTTDGRWGHIMCALLVPEVFFRDPEGRERIDCSRVPHRRWEEICYVCNSVSGSAVECSEPKCSLAFHVTCGLKEELCIEYREGRNGGAIVAGFCKIHTELWKKQQKTGKFKIIAREEHSKQD